MLRLSLIYMTKVISLESEQYSLFLNVGKQGNKLQNRTNKNQLSVDSNCTLR